MNNSNQKAFVVDLSKSFNRYESIEKLKNLKQGCKFIGTYVMTSAEARAEVILPIYSFGDGEIIFAHELNPHLVNHLLMEDRQLKAYVANRPEALTITNSIKSLDFSAGFDLPKLLPMVTPLIGGGGSTKVEVTFDFQEARFSPEFVTNYGDPHESGFKEPRHIVITYSLLSRETLTSPDVLGKIMGMFVGGDNSSTNGISTSAAK